jgi:hypothetical protein
MNRCSGPRKESKYRLLCGRNSGLQLLWYLEPLAIKSLYDSPWTSSNGVKTSRIDGMCDLQFYVDLH